MVTLQPSTPAREPTAWTHAPSQPLMRSPLSQFQTPTAPRRVSRFFRVWLPYRSPRRADHSAYFGLARFISPILSAVDGNQTKQLRYLCQRKIWQENEISVHGIVEKRARFRFACSSAQLPTCALSRTDEPFSNCGCRFFKRGTSRALNSREDGGSVG